jgi:hypothetical protein
VRHGESSPALGSRDFNRFWGRVRTPNAFDIFEFKTSLGLCETGGVCTSLPNDIVVKAGREPGLVWTTAMKSLRGPGSYWGICTIESRDKNLQNAWLTEMFDMTPHLNLK